MTTKVTIKQLEKQYRRITNKGKNRIEVIRHVTQDGRLINKEGYLLSEDEIQRIKKEDEEISKRGGQIVYLTSYCEPKGRP